MIVRRLTPPGPGGVALVEVRGPGAAQTLARRVDALPLVGRVRVCVFRDLHDHPLDEVLLTRAADDAFEVGCHGGPGTVAAVVSALGGATPAPTPRTPRDVAAAALPRCRTERACHMVLAQLDGALERQLDAWITRLPHDLAGVHTELRALDATARLGRALLVPLEVALIGRPNAGKSSLLNAWVGRTRAVVSAEAGTTRDAVGEDVEADGLPVRVWDTAGRRATADPLEAAGVARGVQRAAAAALRVAVLDGLDPHDAPPPDLETPWLTVRTKADRADDFADDLGEDVLWTSAVDERGLPELCRRVRDALVGPWPPADAPVLLPGLLDAWEGARDAALGPDVDAARAALRALRDGAG